MNNWPDDLQFFPAHNFLDNELTLRLLGDSSNGLLTGICGGKLMLRYLPFCFQAGRIFFALDSDKVEFGDQELYFVVQSKTPLEKSVSEDICVVCRGSLRQIDGEREKQRVLALLAGKHPAFSSGETLKLPLYKLSCKHIAGFSSCD